MITNFIISTALCYTITKLSVLIHELGHIFALFITKKKLKLKLQQSTITSVFTYGLYGITFSPIYFYLKRYKYKKDIQNLIKFNAIMGLVFEFLLLVSILLIILSYCFHSQNKNYMILCVSIFHIILMLYFFFNLFKNPSDLRYFRDPKTFTYKYFTPSTEGKEAYIFNPVSIFIFSSVVAFVLKATKIL